MRQFNLIVAFLATTGPIAHVLEMASKLALDGKSWLAIQHNLYRGWGLVFGPVEILALLSSAVSLAAWRQDGARRRAYAIAALCYAAMLANFFLFNAPVNAALNRWTPETLPSDWTDYRLQWEIGHALTALFSVVAFVTLMRQRVREAARRDRV